MLEASVLIIPSCLVAETDDFGSNSFSDVLTDLVLANVASSFLLPLVPVLLPNNKS